MDLVSGTHYKYNEFGRYYYLTPVGAELITGIDELDSVWKNPEHRLQSQGLLLKSLMMISTNDSQQKYSSKKDIVEYMQFKFDKERNSVLMMLGYMAEWAYDVDGDRMAYEERNPMDVFNYLPLPIRIEGNASGMLGLTQVVYSVPADEWQVGY